MVPQSGTKDHIPVMADEVVSYLATELNGAYLDLTSGLGGHLLALSKKLKPEARLYGVDRDLEAIAEAKRRLAKVEQFEKIYHASYSEIGSIVNEFKDKKFNGILLDLGLSSFQLDDESRGFTFMQDGPLDMRFDQAGGGETAKDIVNSWEEEDLRNIFFKYGEERQAKKIASAIVRERQKQMIERTSQLKEIVKSSVYNKFLNKSLARIFQALRIAVNSELERLESVLLVLPDFLISGGRLAVISFHSLEDRIIKNFFREEVKSCICPPRLPQCVCNKVSRLKILTKKALVPSAAELEINSRAKSAKLRVAERI